jgi:hypothetical protein
MKRFAAGITVVGLSLALVTGCHPTDSHSSEGAFRGDSASHAVAFTQPADPKTFFSFRAGADHAPDADVTSAFWKNVPPIVMDKSVLGPAVPAYRAEIRARWTERNLYFLFACKYEKLTVNAAPVLDRETPHLWDRDVIELYIGDFEHTNLYRELQMSPRGEFLDNNIDSTVPRAGLNGEEAWNSGFKVFAHVDEKTKVWYGEMQVPVLSIGTHAARVGDAFRVNVYRQDNVVEPLPAGAGQGRGTRDFVAWQAPGVWNPHHPEVFGVMRLVGE